MRPYLRNSNFMVSCENKTRATDNSFFQHLIHFFVRVVKIRAPLNTSAEQVMQTNTWDTDSVFQNINSLISVESTHLFRSLEARSHIEIIVITQPVCEGTHTLFFEQTLSPLPFLPRENIATLQLRIPILIFRKSAKIKFFRSVKPIVRKPRFYSFTFVSFHPFLIAGTWT